MKECYDIKGIICSIYQELFHSELDSLQMQRPFLMCSPLVSVEQAALFILKLKEHFEIHDETVMEMVEPYDFSLNDLCERIMIVLKNREK